MIKAQVIATKQDKGQDTVTTDCNTEYVSVVEIKMHGEVILLIVVKILSGALARKAGVYSQDVQVWGEHPECQQDLKKIMEGFSKGEFWALKILDASTKIPSGILTGHFVDYGNYDECLDYEGDVRTQYCIAAIVPPQELTDRVTGGFLSSITLRWSYCVPASCPATALQAALREVLKLNVSVADSDCKLRKKVSVTTGEWVGISIWGMFVSFAVASTIYDILARKADSQRGKFLSAFSLYTNGKNLLKTETPPGTMLPLHGLRFLSICWVVLGHRYFFAASSSLLNLADFAEELRKVESQLFVQGVLAVDTFFLLSGLLNCYHLLKVLEKSKRFPVWRYYAHRYIRLTPVLAAVVLMYATWYSLLGDGPVWEQETSMWKQLCVDNWWPTLLYINNYYNPISQCAGQSWYLAVDTQLYWLSPLIILPLWRRPRFGKCLLWALLLLSTIAQFVIAYVYQFRMSFTLGLSAEELERVTKIIYTPTHARATPYIMGLMIGHYLYNLKKSGTRLVLSKGVAAVGWLLATAVALCVVFGNYQFSRPVAEHPYNPWESSVYIALHRIGWGSAVGWIIIACLNNSGGPVNAFLSWRVFVPLSRLTYCIFLSHMAVQQYQVGTVKTSGYFQHFNQVHRYLGDLLTSILVATGLSLVFESPVLALEKLTARKPQERNLKSEVNDGFQGDSSATSKTHEI